MWAVRVFTAEPTDSHCSVTGGGRIFQRRLDRDFGGDVSYDDNVSEIESGGRR